MKKETWKLVIQLIVSVLTAVATTLGVTSCV
ncbi:MAG: smalltalk protein [Prevotella sp.]|nr:smalltalk protein [Prevotella sp.]